MEAGTPQPPHEKTPQEMAESADPAERAEGLRLWVTQIDRKLGTRFYALGAASVLALAAGIVAVVLAIGLQNDSATKSELERLSDEVSDANRAATNAADDDLADLDDRVSELEDAIEGVRSSQSSSDKEISVLQDDINDLRDQIAELESDVQDAQDAAAADDTSDDTSDEDSP